MVVLEQQNAVNPIQINANADNANNVNNSNNQESEEDPDEANVTNSSMELRDWVPVVERPPSEIANLVSSQSEPSVSSASDPERQINFVSRN